MALGLAEKRRAVGFLEDSSGELDAAKEFAGLGVNKARELKSKMDYWIDGGPPHKKYCHGWDEQKYKHCWVFKLKNKRFYGFVCHPRPDSDAGFLLCVLIYHDMKYQQESNYGLLDRINVLRESPSVTIAIKRIYPEYKGGKTWPN
jgi:hypothetical protein